MLTVRTLHSNRLPATQIQPRISAGKSALENLILDTKEWLRFNRNAGMSLFACTSEPAHVESQRDDCLALTLHCACLSDCKAYTERLSKLKDFAGEVMAHMSKSLAQRSRAGPPPEIID